MNEPVVILGCGYTGSRVAQRRPVIATNRSGGQGRIAFEITANPDLSFIPEGSRVLYSIPEVPEEMVTALAARRPVRVVYISTTGVYGSAFEVDHTTPPDPSHERIAFEKRISEGPWSSMILRAAAIYGPDRGVHVSMLEGRFQLADEGSNYVSRIHVEDLATHCEAALFSEAMGAWPVADDHPCTTREIAEYCANLLGMPMPPSVPRESLHRTRRANRKVDGRAVRAALGITLRYPSYREGLQIPR